MAARKPVGSLSLYKDCLRVIKHMAGDTPKAQNLRNIVRDQFRQNMDVVDPDKIEDLKSDALRGIANYITLTNSSKDKKIAAKQKEMMQAGHMQSKEGKEKEEDAEDLSEMNPDDPSNSLEDLAKFYGKTPPEDK